MSGQWPSPAEVHGFLNDVDYPCQKEDIVRHATRRGASEGVLDVLRALPLGEYTSKGDVTKGLSPQAPRRS